MNLTGSVGPRRVRSGLLALLLSSAAIIAPGSALGMKLTINGVDYPRHPHSGVITEFTQNTPPTLGGGPFRPHADSFTRLGIIGTFGAGSRRRNNVIFFFRLPGYSDNPQQIVSAGITLEVLDKTDLPQFDVDVYSLGIENSAQVDTSWLLFAANDPSGPVKIASGFIQPASIGTVQVQSGETGALVQHLRALYQAGAKEGDILALRLNPAANISATAGGTSGYVLGFVDPDLADTDLDGLPDEWEINGYPVGADGDPGFVDLPAMGADPLHKDIFVEVDCALGLCPSHTAMEIVRESFARVPNQYLNNPDGADGISLHIDAGPTFVMKVNPAGGVSYWGGRSRSDELNMPAVVGTSGGTAQFLHGEFVDHMEINRKRIFRYALYVGRYQGKIKNRLCEYVPNTESSGVSIIGSQIFLVALESKAAVSEYNWGKLPFNVEAGVFMHELGHTLGLEHGGFADDINFKPNYFSVMNYAYIFDGLAVRSSSPAPEATRYDYALFDVKMIDETSLDEGEPLDLAIAGSAASAAEIYSQLSYFCPEPLTVANPERRDLDTFDSQTDWNCDGLFFFDVTDANLNKDSAIIESQCSQVRGQLTAPADWNRLVYLAGGMGAGRRLFEASDEPLLDEPDDGRALPDRDYGVYLSSPRAVAVEPDAAVSVMLRNFGGLPDSYSLSTKALLGNVSAALGSDSVQLAPGESATIELALDRRPTIAQSWDLVTVTAQSNAAANISGSAEVTAQVALFIDGFE